MSRYLKLAFMAVTFDSTVAAGIAWIRDHLGIALVAIAVSTVCAGYPVVKTGGWK